MRWDEVLIVAASHLSVARGRGCESPIAVSGVPPSLVAEIDGPGSYRTAADSKPQRSSSARAKTKSSSSRATKTSTRKKTASGGGAKSTGKVKKS
jgi:hypothetical protein